MRTDDEGPRYNEDELRMMKYWSDRSEAAVKALDAGEEDEFGDAEHAEFVQGEQY